MEFEIPTDKADLLKLKTASYPSQGSSEVVERGLLPRAGWAGRMWCYSGLGVGYVVLHGGSGSVDIAAGNVQSSQGLFGSRGSKDEGTDRDDVGEL